MEKVTIDISGIGSWDSKSLERLQDQSEINNFGKLFHSQLLYPAEVFGLLLPATGILQLFMKQIYSFGS